jgi:hypothetical protein
MRAHDRARALAIDVQVADVELLDRPRDLLFRAGIRRAGQAELGVVGDAQALVEVTALDHGQHRPEDLLLLDGVAGLHVGDDGRLQEVAFPAPWPVPPPVMMRPPSATPFLMYSWIFL